MKTACEQELSGQPGLLSISAMSSQHPVAEILTYTQLFVMKRLVVCIFSSWGGKGSGGGRLGLVCPCWLLLASRGHKPGSLTNLDNKLFLTVRKVEILTSDSQ